MKKEGVRVLVACLFVAGLVVLTGLEAQERKVTVLNPLGQPPPITQVSMAARLDTLDGKTIYIVDVGFEGTHQFFTEMKKMLEEKYPKTAWILREKAGNYFEDDPALWAEIKAKGNGMIMGLGH